jgi:hypothetical protein
MSIELKIKSKHLGEEARIIRFEENKLAKQVEWARNKHYSTGNNDEYAAHNDKNYRTWYSLNRHRRWDVRNENRATFLARAYIEGKPYVSVETKRKPENEYCFYQFVLPRLVAMVAKYGNDKVPLKVYDRTKGGYIDNPELSRIAKSVTAWLDT